MKYYIIFSKNYQYATHHINEMKLKSFLSNFYESVIRLFIRRMISAVNVILAAADLPNLDRRREAVDNRLGTPVEKGVLFVIVRQTQTIKPAD